MDERTYRKYVLSSFIGNPITNELVEKLYKIGYDANNSEVLNAMFEAVNAVQDYREEWIKLVKEDTKEFEAKVNAKEETA